MIFKGLGLVLLFLVKLSLILLFIYFFRPILFIDYFLMMFSMESFFLFGEIIIIPPDYYLLLTADIILSDYEGNYEQADDYSCFS